MSLTPIRKLIVLGVVSAATGWWCGRTVPVAHAECEEEGMYAGDGEFLLDLRSTDPEVERLWPVVRLHGPLIAEGVAWDGQAIHLSTSDRPMVLRLMPVNR